MSWKFQMAKITPKTHKEQQGTTTGQERRKLFLRYVNRGWLVFGFVTLIAYPFFLEQRGQFIYLIATIFPTYLIVRFLSLSGRMKLAGIIFTIAVNFGFYGLFLVLVHDLGAEEAFRTQATIWMLMGLAILFAGAFVDKWAAPILAFVDTVLLIGTRLMLAPDARAAGVDIRRRAHFRHAQSEPGQCPLQSGHADRLLSRPVRLPAETRGSRIRIRD